ncbi:3-deoxy-D-manno-octulosonic acid transferase [Candidatus Pelagibacter sp.]|uniref:3-deoxy-D-manno-octulosonic acid transferase n=1 Tax=Candidatus Pelagibacter sp. TaxID=2024849 RepID=UPI003F843727
MIFFIYQFLLSITLIFSPIIVIIRILKNKEDKLRFKEKFCFISKKRGSGKLVWFHGSSVGEILSVIPIIKKYDNDKSIGKILITSSTLSSSKILEKIKFKKTIHQFYPIDHAIFSRKFLNHWKPNIAIFLESEIWPSMFKSIKNRNILLILLNARITKKSFDRWSKMKKFSNSIFGLIDKAYSQNSETSHYLGRLNVKNIKSTGNIKFIEYDNVKSDKSDKKLFSQFKKYKIFIAASTHETEELFAAKTHIILKKKNKNIITIIIPRHINRVKQIIYEIKELGLNVVSRSSKKSKLKDIDIFIVDTFGESKKFYRFATTVFLGKSIVKGGGQNPLEPARFGAKILHGPDVNNFKDVYKYLNRLKISSVVNSPQTCANSIVFKKNMKKVQKMKYLGSTILKKTLNELDKSIHNEI